MPPTTLMSVVINRSELKAAKRQTSPKVKPRTYNDEPLPIQVSDHAPHSATIISRVFEGGVVTFELKIGETVLPDVGLEEVLDYVSAYHLEEYENKAFQEEEVLLKVAEEEDRKFKEEQDARRRERAKTKGTVVMQETSSEGAEDNMDIDGNTGKHGRARPSYKPLFLQVRQRKRRRKRDPVTGQLLPRSDDDMGGEEQEESSSDDRFESKPEGEAVSLDNLPRRRRRRRDPITGELLSLDPEPSAKKPTVSRSVTVDKPEQVVPGPPEKQKRPRRRRHPINNELMPLGWRYDPEEERRAKEKETKVPSMQRLSISKESEPKRRRLDRSASSNEQSRSSNLATQSESNRRQGATVAPLSAFKQGNVISLHGSDSDDDSHEDSIEVKPAGPKPKLVRRGVGGASVSRDIEKSPLPSKSPGPSSQSRLPVRVSPRKPGLPRLQSASSNSSIIPLQIDDADSSSEEESEEDNATKPPPPKPVTSIMHPSAVTDEQSSSEESSEDEELPDDEWVVEGILRHALSNPKTHPDSLGKQPIMLYEVKWADSKETTWEPETSFGSLDVVREYQRRVGMK
jgi:hypothetical protein